MKTNEVSFAKNINKLFSCLSLAAVCLMAVSPAAYASVAGHVQFVSGDVRIANPAGQARSAQKGDAINEGDTLTSAPKSSAQIKMQDGGFIAIRPDSQMKFDQFVFAGKEDGSEKSFFSVFKGGFRAITGAIGQVNKQNYRITTPTASIGIRGSDHETLVIIPGSPLAQLAPTGSYSKVNVGGTSMTTNEGTLNVGPNQMGFAGSLDQSPQLQPLNTNLFTVAPAPTLSPGANAGETENEQEGTTQGTGSTTQEETPPIRETATIDAGTPVLAPASPPPVLIPATPAQTTPTQTTAGGTTANLISGTATTNTGQVISITQSLAAAQAAAEAAAQAAAQAAAEAAAQAAAQAAAEAAAAAAAAAAASAQAAYVATNTAVAYSGSYGGSFNFIAAPGDLTPVGNPTTFIQRYADGTSFRTDILSGATTNTQPTTTANGITFGVWESVTDVSSSDQMPIMPNQKTSKRTLPSYMYGAEGYLDSAIVAGTNSGPLTGNFTYNQLAATSYDSSSWTSGTVTATMSANFTNQTVSMGLSGTMGANNWTLGSTNKPITFMNTTTGTGARFTDAAPVITVNTTNCAPNCGGNISGAFLGQNYAGAIVQYSLWDNNNLNLGGLIGFDNATPVTPGAGTSPGTFVVANSWLISGQTAITTDTATGVLTGWNGNGWNSVVSPATDSLASTPAGTGSGTINWGLWGSGSVNTNNFSYVPGAAQFHWITAPEPTPIYLAQVLTTSNAVYNYVDGDVTSLTGGVHGTINGTTSLTANFTTQTVAANLELTVNGHNWLANTPNALLQYSNGNTLNAFSADSYRSPALPGYLTVTVDGAGANGNLAGQLVGVALDGAILKFNLDGQVTTPTMGYEWVQGVAALGAAVANDPATPYRMLLTSMSEPMALVPTVILGGAYNNATRVLTDVNGLTQFDDNSGGGNETIQRVSGTYADQGSAVIGGETISWGRWGAGTVVDVTDRATNTVQTGITLTGGAHTVVGPIATGPVSLPTSGTYTYNPVGNTLPTDQAGVAGTLNSATLSANFTAQTVDVGVNVTAGGATLDAIATGVAIQNRANFFTDSRMTGAGALSVSCTGSCGTANHGAIGGGFGGPGGVAAAITYGFEKSGANAGTVNGVAVFQQGAALTAQ
ncbi:MAG: FecR domain-containing protein [Gallionella sp.]|nr:FecR domain-containing protein [Gallionella sp.]MDP1941674.1 FecR domain-containing protein [Gallionella sp.]